ncbi:MAG: amidohydrolase [Lachnospiraceae bacterium]|nr:amidohydrolase [Lachnospiraceae bacterium]
MNIRFYNARILTMKEPIEIRNGELWVKDKEIVYVGDGSDKDEVLRTMGPSYSFERELDCKGNVLMPGFKDAHTHTAMTLMRSHADDMPLNDWLNQQIFPIEANMGYEEVYQFTKLGVLEYLTSGITAAMDMYLDPQAIFDAFTECGFRNVQVSGINKFGPTLEVMEERYNKFNGVNDLSSYMLGFHAEYTCEKELLQGISEMAHKYKAPVYTHGSETKAEVQGCIDRYGMTPTEFCDSLGLFDFGGGIYHGCHVTQKDMDIFLNRGLYEVTNPGSNTKLASGIAPVSLYRKRGIPIAIGTDGPASNNALDFFREMFLVTGLAKLRDGDAASTDALEVLKMATVNGAKCMHLNDCETLSVGQKADLIMIDMHQPNMQPIHNIPKNIVYSGSKQNVKLTMINGKILYEDGEFFVGCDVEKLYETCSKIIDKMGVRG